MKTNDTPKGQLVLRTLAMPADTNPAGDIFGGWIMSQMDIAGGILAKEFSCMRIVTVGVNSISFIKPVHVGDTVCCYGEILKVGKTSITVNLEVWVRPAQTDPEQKVYDEKVTQAAFTYVAVDDKGRKKAITRDCAI